MPRRPRPPTSVPIELPAAVFGPIWPIYEQASNSLNEIISHVRESARTATALARLLEVPPADLRWDKIHATADKLSTSLQPLKEHAVLGKLIETAHGVVEQVIAQFPELMRRLSEQLGCPLYGATPDFIVDGILLVVLDVKRRRLLVNGSSVSFFPWPAAAGYIIQAHQRIRATPFNPNDFLRDLWESYREALAAKQRLPGDRISVNELIRRLMSRREPAASKLESTSRKVLAYGRATLRGDLHRLLAASSTPTYQGDRLVLEAGSFAREGIYMYLLPLGRCGYVNQLLFRPPSAGEQQGNNQ